MAFDALRRAAGSGGDGEGRAAAAAGALRGVPPALTGRAREEFDSLYKDFFEVQY
eukprot:gene4183-17993_t